MDESLEFDGFNLRDYQREGIAFLERNGGCGGLFMDMRTGKSRTLLAYVHKHSRRVLIVCLNTFAHVWQREIQQLPITLPVHMLTSGSTARRAAYVKKHLMGQDAIVLVNYEAYWRDPLRTALLRWQPDTVVADEAHALKHRMSKQSKFAHLLATQSWCKHRIALTGTPIGNGIEDLFSLYKYVDPKVFGTRWSDFADRHIRFGGWQNKQIIGYRDTDTVHQRVRDTAYQISRSEAFQLADPDDVVVPIDLTDESRKRYDKLKKHSLLEVTGDGPDGLPVTGTALSRVALTNILRLQQLTGGFIHTDKGIIDTSTEKLDACVELVGSHHEQGDRVAIYCRFKRDIERICERLGIPLTDTYSGFANQDQRTDAWERLNTGALRTLVCQIRVASLGLDLTAASVGIFYSTGFSLTDFAQTQARLQGPRQTKAVTHYYLTCHNTVDVDVIQALLNKQNIARMVTDLSYTRQLFS